MARNKPLQLSNPNGYKASYKEFSLGLALVRGITSPFILIGGLTYYWGKMKEKDQEILWYKNEYQRILGNYQEKCKGPVYQGDKVVKQYTINREITETLDGNISYKESKNIKADRSDELWSKVLQT